MSRGRLAIAWLVAAGSLGIASPAGAATVNLGQIAPMGPTGGCGGCTYFQSGTDVASPSYAVPPGGPWTVTSWSTRGGSMPDSARLRVLRPTATPGQFQLVAESADVAVGVVAAPVTQVSIPVLPGDLLGLRTLGSGDMPGAHPAASAADRTSFVIGGPFLLGQTTGPGGTFPFGTNAANRVNVSATLTAPDPTPGSKEKKKCKKAKKKKGKTASAAAKKKKKKCGRKKKKKVQG